MRRPARSSRSSWRSAPTPRTAASGRGGRSTHHFPCDEVPVPRRRSSDGLSQAASEDKNRKGRKGRKGSSAGAGAAASGSRERWSTCPPKSVAPLRPLRFSSQGALLNPSEILRRGTSREAEINRESHQGANRSSFASGRSRTRKVHVAANRTAGTGRLVRQRVSETLWRLLPRSAQLSVAKRVLPYSRRRKVSTHLVRGSPAIHLRRDRTSGGILRE